MKKTLKKTLISIMVFIMLFSILSIPNISQVKAQGANTLALKEISALEEFYDATLNADSTILANKPQTGTSIEKVSAYNNTTKELKEVGLYQKSIPNVTGVVYQTHVQSEGWQDWKSNGEMSGTSGISYRLEGINIKLNNMSSGMGIKYSTHIEDIGWQDWKTNGQMSGTEGQSKRLEGIKIELVGAPAGYHIEYRVHVQDIGWQEWKRDGDIAGTSGQSKRLEGVELKIVKDNIMGVTYQTHVQEEGWQGWRTDGAMSGTSGKSYRLEGINIKLTDAPTGTSIKYSTHIQDLGWQDWKSNGQMSGTEGQAKRLEGIKVELVGAPEGYHVEYRVHVQDYGWQDWKRDGAIAGTSGESKRLEGIEIRIVPKNTPSFNQELTNKLNSTASKNGFGISTKSPYFKGLAKDIVLGKISASSGRSSILGLEQWEDSCNINNGNATYKVGDCSIADFSTSTTDTLKIVGEALNKSSEPSGTFVTYAAYQNADGSNRIVRLAVVMTATVWE